MVMLRISAWARFLRIAETREESIHPERKSPDEAFNERLIKAFIERGLFWRERK